MTSAGRALFLFELALAYSSKPLSFHDINILIVTDAHSWIYGHVHPDHSPLLDAGYGDIASTVEHIKAAAAAEGKDVFFVNNGDHVEGSGLSDASVYEPPYIHGFDLFPLIQLMPFDALTIGNHDLYEESTVVFMQESGFIKSWQGSYLTSNTLNSSTGETIGSKMVVLTGSNSGVRVMVFGFLYHMTDSCDAVSVEDPAATVKEAWFLNALDQAFEGQVDAIVILLHADLKDENVDIIHSAVRGHSDELAHMPLLFVTGHSHYRGFSSVDDHSASFESGHYLDTLGWISFDIGNPNMTFAHEFIDANLNVLHKVTGTDPSSFQTELGGSVANEIESTVERLGLRNVLGCPTQNYSLSSPIGASDSLYDFYMNFIIPNAVFDISTGTGNLPYHYSSTGSLRYNVYSPLLYYDDIFAIAPFANTFKYYPNILGSEVVAVGSILTGGGSSGASSSVKSHSRQRTKNPLQWQTASLPAFVGGPYGALDDASSTYDLFFNEYDAPSLAAAIAQVRGVDAGHVVAAFVPWRADRGSPEEFVDTTLCWAKNISSLWPCKTDN